MIDPSLVPLLLLFAILIVINLVGIRVARNRPSTRRETPSFEPIPVNLQNRSDQVMLQLEEFSRVVSGQVDNKIQYLETLVSEADRKIDELQRLDKNRDN